MVGLFGVASVLLFGAARLGIDTDVQPHRVWLVIGVAFSGFWLLAHIGEVVAPSASRAWRRHRARRHLRHLNPEEQKYCKFFLDTDGKPLPHNPGNGAIASLVQNGIVWRPEQGWQNNQLFEFNIQPWALAYLRKHPEHVAKAD
jgi:hypothetical protein